MLPCSQGCIQRDCKSIKRSSQIGTADFGGSYFYGFMSDIQRKIALSGLYQKKAGTNKPLPDKAKSFLCTQCTYFVPSNLGAATEEL